MSNWTCRRQTSTAVQIYRKCFKNGRKMLYRNPHSPWISKRYIPKRRSTQKKRYCSDHLIFGDIICLFHFGPGRVSVLQNLFSHRPNSRISRSQIKILQTQILILYIDSYSCPLSSNCKKKISFSFFFQRTVA